MKQKIDRLARGQFEYSLPEIILSEEKIVISTIAGTDFRGSFIIKNSRGTSMKGVLYSSSRLLTLSASQFIGEETKIDYIFKAEYVDPGEKIRGSVNIITDCGETELPFEAIIRPPYCSSSVGEIRDLFQLANLAKTDWKEAEALFVSDNFVKALPYYDKELAETYRHLSPDVSTGHALEELLVSIRKKAPVSITADKNRLEYNAGIYSFLDKIILTKNTWGYAEYKVSANAAFVRPRSSRLDTSMFAGNTYELGLVIDPSKLHAGLNLAVIKIENAVECIEIPVVCHNGKHDSAEAVHNRRIKQDYSRLVSNYIRFRLSRQSLAHYANEAENILTGLWSLSDGDDAFVKVYRGHLLLSEGKENQFRELLSELEGKIREYKKQPVIYAGILYLSAMYKKEQETTDNAIRTIRDLWAKYPEEWMLLWFILNLDRSLNTPARRLEVLSEAFYQGQRSPVLYYEAAAAFNESPDCLSTLKLFELEVLNFSVRNTMMAQGLAAKFAFAAHNFDEYSCLLERSLRRIYEIYPTRELLEALCHVLMAGKKTDARSHYFYSKAIETGLEIPGLHEAYIESAPMDSSVLLEHSTLNYFAYNCMLAADRKAYLYANVVKHAADYAFIWQVYEPQIREFTLEKLKDGDIDENLAVLYDQIIPKLPLTAELASLIPRVCFYYEVSCSAKSLVAVYVSHKELEGEILVPMNNGKAYIELYTEKADVIFGDAEGHRYLSTADYRITKLVHLDNLLEECSRLAGNDAKLVLHVAERMRYEQRSDENAVELMKQVTHIKSLKGEYVRDYVKELIYYYYDNYEGDLLENYLLQIDLKMLEHSERVKIIEFMIIRDLYNVALKAMDEFGFDGIDVRRLMKLCSRLLLNAGGMEKVDVLVAACFRVFSEGSYDETILRYLTDYYYGTTAEMFELWKAAKTFEIDTCELEERLLGQMLFAESYISNAKAVFINYYRTGTNKTLIKAFLSYYAYKYLINDRIVEKEIFDIMRAEIKKDYNEICLLAVLKFYSGCEQLTDAEVKFVDYHLNRLEQRELVLPFFRNFKNSMRISQDICDRYFVEYRTAPGSNVKIHYCFEDGNGSSEFIDEEMHHVCYGIYVKEFVLFGNESLQYYMTEGSGDDEIITESTEVRLNPEQSMGEDTKYYQLNMIISAREMHDEKTALKLLDNYVRTDYAIGKLFSAI